MNARRGSSILGAVAAVGLSALPGSAQNIGDVWLPLATHRRLPARPYLNLAYDTSRAEVLSFSGGSGFTIPLFEDTFRFDGSSWTETSIPTPPGSFGSALYSARWGSLVVSQRTSDAVRLFRWAGSAGWVALPATCHPPSWAFATPRLLELPDGRLLLHTESLAGGRHVESWIHDGADWTLVGPRSATPAVQVPHLVADPDGGALLLGAPLTDPRTDTLVLRRHAVGEGPGFHAVGPGCRGSRGRPRLRLLDGTAPRLGSELRIEIAPLPVNRAAVVWLTLGLRFAPLDLGLQGLPGCVLAFESLDDVLLANLFGRAEWRVAIPDEPALQGGVVYLQSLGSDPGAVFGDVVPGEPAVLFLDR